MGQCRHVLSYYPIEYRVPFSRQISSSLVSVAMEIRGTIPTLLHFWTFVQTFFSDIRPHVRVEPSTNNELVIMYLNKFIFARKHISDYHKKHNFLNVLLNMSCRNSSRNNRTFSLDFRGFPGIP